MSAIRTCKLGHLGLVGEGVLEQQIDGRGRKQGIVSQSAAVPQLDGALAATDCAGWWRPVMHSDHLGIEPHVLLGQPIKDGPPDVARSVQRVAKLRVGTPCGGVFSIDDIREDAGKIDGRHTLAYPVGVELLGWVCPYLSKSGAEGRQENGRSDWAPRQIANARLLRRLCVV